MPATLAYPLNALLMMVLPIALGILIERKYHPGWGLWWIGAGTFIFSQVGHIPFNIGLTALFQRGVLPSPPKIWTLAFNATILGLSAGLWEELARYATYRWWAKEARSWRKGVMLGAGHGGIEAILTGILVLVNFTYMLAIRNSDLTNQVPMDQLGLAQQVMTQYWSAPWYTVFLGALERAFALPIQISFSLLVLQSIVRKQPGWLFLAVGWHALVDGAAVYIMGTQGVYTAEAVLGVFCLLSLAVIFAMRRPEPEEGPEQPEINTPLQPPPQIDFDRLETPEKLDETRFQ